MQSEELVAQAFQSQVSKARNSNNSYTFYQMCCTLEDELSCSGINLGMNVTKNNLEIYAKTVKQKCVDL